jgi:hypothetical protein
MKKFRDWVLFTLWPSECGCPVPRDQWTAKHRAILQRNTESMCRVYDAHADRIRPDGEYFGRYGERVTVAGRVYDQSRFLERLIAWGDFGGCQYDKAGYIAKQREIERVCGVEAITKF